MDYLPVQTHIPFKLIHRLALDLGGNLYAVPRPGRNHTKDQADSHDRSYARGCISIITFAKNPQYSLSFSQPSTGHDSTKSKDCSLTQVSNLGGAQWLSWESVRLGIKGLLIRASPSAESLCCVFEQDPVSAA